MARKKKSNENPEDGLPLTAQEQKKLSFAPPLDLESKNVDTILAKIVIITYLSLIDLKNISHKNIVIEENRQSTVFLYHIENTAKNISGYIGRDKHDGNIRYIAVDNSRFQYAEKEGFFDSELDYIENRANTFTSIGVLIELDGLNSFLNFIAGDKDFVFVGDYITKTL
jgi:hypothetical protein